MALEEAGLQLIAQGVNQYISAVNQSNSATTNFYGTLEKGEGVSNGFAQVVTGALRRVGEVAVNALGDATRAVGGFLKDAVTSAGTFEQGMNVLKVVSGATADQMNALSKEAIALGNDITLPGTSAQDAGDAMNELSKAGLNVKDTMDAAKGTLQLMTAAETNAGNAAQIVAGSLQTFHLEGKEAGRVADLLAASANASSANITDLSQGTQQAGFIFAATGQKIDDLDASLALLSNVGLSGSDAGTAVKNAMIRLVNPTKKASELMASLGINVYDANGKMLPFDKILDVVNNGLKGMTDEQRNAALGTIFLSDGMKAMIPLLSAGSAGFNEMKAKINQHGAAAALAGAQTKGFTGATAALGNALDTLKLIIGTQLLPLLTPLINQVASAVGVFGTFIQAITGDKDALASLPPFLHSIISAFQLWQAGTISLKTALDSIMPGLGSIAPIIQTALSSILPFITAFGDGGMAGVIQLAVEKLSTISPVFAVIVGTIQAAIPLVQTIISTFQSLVSQSGITTSMIGDAWVTVQGLVSGAVQAILGTVQTVFGTINRFIPIVMQAIYGVISSVLTQIMIFWQAHGTEIMAFVQTTWSQISEIINTTLQLVLSAVTIVLRTISALIDTHGNWIQEVLTNAWNIISGVITVALNLIMGTVKAALQILQGNWQGAWDTIQQACAVAVQAAYKIIVNGLDLIAHFFGTSLQGIVDIWRGNWDMMIQIVNKIPGLLANVGSAIVGSIRDGFSRAWEDFMGSVRRKLQEFQDMLPFSEPKDSSSPLYGLGKSGEAMIGMIQAGIDSAGPLTIPPAVIETTKRRGDEQTPAGTKEDAERFAARMTITDDLVQRMAVLLGGFAQPPATADQVGAANSTSYSNTTNLNMPIYTNQSPSCIQSSLAIAGAALT